MTIDAKWLAEKASGKAIDSDRRCVCGYNLQGLKIGGSCPECGRTIPLASGRRAHIPKFTHYPTPLLTRLARATTLLAVGMWGIALGYMLMWFFRGGWVFGADVSPALSLMVMLLTVLPASALWWLGTVLLIRRDHAPEDGSRRAGPDDVLAEHPPWFLWAMVFGQALWPVGALAAAAGLFISEAHPGVADALLLCAIGACAIASLLLSPVCLVLKDLAYCATDDYACNRFRGLAFGIPFVGLLFALFPMVHLVVGFSRLVSFMGLACLSLLLTPPAYLMLMALWSLGTTCRWARANAQSAEEATERFRERARSVRR